MDDSDDREYSRAPELSDLLELCQALNAEEVRYVLIGGFAVILHGFVRTTNNAASLLLTRSHVEDDAFILLDGDVVFDIDVIEELVDRGPDCLAVRSVGTIGLEEVKVTADNYDRVLAIGKHVPVRSVMD